MMASTSLGPAGLYLALSATNFAQGLAAFSVIGIVGLVAADYGLPMHAAGWLMSLYAAVYVVASPLLVSLSGTLDRRTVLGAGLAVIALAAAVAAVAPTFAVLLVARCAMAFGGAVTTPVAASIGVATSTPAQRGRALAIVFAGLALSQAVGVPFGAWLGALFSWRAAMVAVCIVALLALVGVVAKVPRGTPVSVPGLPTLYAVLRNPRSVAAVSFIVFYIGCNFTLLTYLAPYLAQRFALGPDALAACLLLYGISAFFGNGLGGWLTDRFGPKRTLVLLACVMVVTLPVLTLVPLPLAPTLVLIAGWGAFGWAVHVPQQARLALVDPPRAPVLLALHSSGIYLGAAAGASLAGLVMQSGQPQWLGPAGAVLALLALASLPFTSWLGSPAARRVPHPASGLTVDRG
jgi:DHA1 family inner membrane transport protein